MEPTPPSVREASARLAAIRRHRPGDAQSIRDARWALVVAQAAALTAEAARLLNSGGE